MDKKKKKVYKDISLKMAGKEIPCIYKWHNADKFEPSKDEEFILVLRYWNGEDKVIPEVVSFINGRFLSDHNYFISPPKIEYWKFIEDIK